MECFEQNFNLVQRDVLWQTEPWDMCCILYLLYIHIYLAFCTTGEIHCPVFCTTDCLNICFAICTVVLLDRIIVLCFVPLAG